MTAPDSVDVNLSVSIHFIGRKSIYYTSKYNMVSIYKKCEVKGLWNGGDIVLTVVDSEQSGCGKRQAWESACAGRRLGDGD